MENRSFRHPQSLDCQAHFSLVDVFHESLEYVRNYTLPFNMIGICTRSEGEGASVSVNLETGEACSMRENDISLVPSNRPHQYRHTLRNERYGIHFKLEICPGIDVFRGVTHRIVENSPELRREADTIFAIEDPVLMLSRCQEFALRFCHRHWPDHYDFDMERIKPFDDVLQYVRTSVSASLQVADLAARMHRSSGNFSREFRAVFGQPPKRFLQTELLKKAAQMLLSPHHSVKTVAAELGFSSEFYFSKFFKRLSGISPSECQKRSIFRP